MATSKLKSMILASEQRGLYNIVKEFMNKKNLSHRIELTQLDTGKFTEENCERCFTEELSKANSDVLLVDYSDISLIVEPLTSFLCSDKCNYKLVQFTFAGVDWFTKVISNLKLNHPKVDICRFGGYFGPHMAEYVIGSIVSRERHFIRSAEDQKQHKWCREFKYRRLSTLSIGIIGTGDIGRHIAKTCKMFGMTVWGITKSKVMNKEPSIGIDHYRQLDGLKEMMSSCDYICNLLPSTPDTRGILTEEHFKCCTEKKSVFINVGRGDVTSDDIIVRSIKNGWLGGAILDVFEHEPLPVDSPLWDLPQVSITPHDAACSQIDEIAEMFVNQLERVLEGHPVTYKVDFTNGY